MASKSQALVLLLCLITFSSTITSSLGRQQGIAVYWGQGQNNGDGTLKATCDSFRYQTVLLAFLTQFGCDREVKWDFAGHCGDESNSCTNLQSEIQYCQSKGIKVLLSIGGPDVFTYDYDLCSPQDAKNVSKYLYDNFLSGQDGPLGNVTLDGIDFHIEKTDLYWDDLVKELDTYRQNGSKYFYLSAAPECPTEPKIYYLQKAIQTGLFDYIFVQFYNNPKCDYSPIYGIGSLLNSWDKWTSIVKNFKTSIYLGLPAAKSAAKSGYMPPVEVVNPGVLPVVRKTPNYGGVMVWDRYRDVEADFSGLIIPYVSNSNVILEPETRVSDV